MPKQVSSKTFESVLNNFIVNFKKQSPEIKKDWAKALNSWLDEIRDDDGFGTEGQLDPRGDNRLD